jgi:hypothetical protein
MVPVLDLPRARASWNLELVKPETEPKQTD